MTALHKVSFYGPPGGSWSEHGGRGADGQRERGRSKIDLHATSALARAGAISAWPPPLRGSGDHQRRLVGGRH